MCQNRQKYVLKTSNYLHMNVLLGESLLGMMNVRVWLSSKGGKICVKNRKMCAKTIEMCAKDVKMHVKCMY